MDKDISIIVYIFSTYVHILKLYTKITRCMSIIIVVIVFIILTLFIKEEGLPKKSNPNSKKKASVN